MALSGSSLQYDFGIFEYRTFGNHLQRRLKSVGLHTAQVSHFDQDLPDAGNFTPAGLFFNQVNYFKRKG